MLDVGAVEKAERQLNDFIDSQATRRQGQDAANLTAIEERERTERKVAAQRERNRYEWIAFYRRLAASNLAAARDYRARARALETEGDAA